MAIPNTLDNQLHINKDDNLDEQLRNLPGKPGVCLLTASGDKPIILLSGTNLRMLVKRRLTNETEEGKSKKADLRPLVTKIYYKLSYNKFQTQLQYFFTAKEIYPDSWQKLFPKLNCFYLHLDSSGIVPTFKVTEHYNQKPGRYWGPFATKASADRMLESVIVIHKLCRCSRNLINIPNNIPCSYSQMNLCPLVCNGTMSVDEYLNLINSAVAFLDNPVKTEISRIKNDIQDCCKKLEFEKAEKLKRTLDECKKLTNKAYRWVGPMENFIIGCFQHGPKFLKDDNKKEKEQGIISITITPAKIKTYEPKPLSEVLDLTENMLSDIQTLQSNNNSNNVDQYLLSWLCQLLNKSDNNKGLFIRLNSNLTSSELAGTITEHFSDPQADQS